MSIYQWCLHCERVSKKKGEKECDLECPYDNCDGSAWDLFDWDEHRKEILDQEIRIKGKVERTDLPKVPEEGKTYLLYLER